jgi:hypothetical protein
MPNCCDPWILALNQPEGLTTVGTPPPTGCVVHARLVRPLNSASSKKGETVEAIITEPLLASGHLILPEGSVSRGSVTQAQPARRMARNGQLRILFHEVAPPNAVGGEGRDQPRRGCRGERRTLETRLGGRGAGDDTADAVLDDGHSSNVGGDVGRAR